MKIPYRLVLLTLGATSALAAGAAHADETADGIKGRPAKEVQEPAVRAPSERHRLMNLNLEDGGKLTDAGTIPADQAPRTIRATPVPWRETQYVGSGDARCGVKALFAFLRLHGIAVTLRELESQLAVGPHGVDMLQLRDIANKHGVKSRVVDCTPAQLKSHLPAITRMSMGTGSEANHYLVVSRLSDLELTYVEPATCRVEQASSANMSRYFTGHALVADVYASGERWPMPAIILGGIACVEAAAIGIILLRKRRI